MNRAEQFELVSALINSLRMEVIVAIQQDKVPDTWNGIELRQYIADKAASYRFVGTMDAKRKAAYNAAVLERNL